MNILTIVFLVVAAALGSGGFYLLNSKKKEEKGDTAEPVKVKSENSSVDRNTLVLEAKAKAKDVIIEAKGLALKIKTRAEEEARKIKEEALESERRMNSKKAEIEARAKEIESKARTLKAAKEAIEKKQEQVEGFRKKQQEELEKVATLSKEEAKKELLASFDKELSEEKGRRVKEIEEQIKKEAEGKVQNVLIEALEFGATDIVVEHSTSKVKLPDEDLKGRIIGKEGRNIRVFEQLTGVELDLDSSPGEIIVSCFDSVRRAIATKALERLIADGRIQPARIEEIVEKTRSEMESEMFKAGDDLCHKLGVYNLPKELVQTLGRFKYRFSYGQNVLEHTLEMARIGSYIAKELDVNEKIVKTGCLLHDIGKVLTDKDGSHVDLGIEMLRKFNIPDEIIACVSEHHDDSHTSIESAIVALCDHVSGTRPGSRGEDYEAYIKRLKDLEEAAMLQPGVEKAYAVSAGRELRVFVSPEKVDDFSTGMLARDIAKKIELEQTYPGVVKVIVIRETRVSETAK
ncbi:ribonuclease Y [Patescibacteria group bacterium]